MCILRYMPASDAVGVEHDRRVVIQARPRGARTASRPRPRRARRAAAASASLVGPGIGSASSKRRVILALAGILAGEQLLQADDVGAGRGRFADPARSPCSTLRLFDGVARHLHQGHHDRPAARRRAMACLRRFELMHRTHGNLCPMARKPVTRTIYYRHRHGSRQDLRGGADRARRWWPTGIAWASTSRPPAAARRDDGDAGFRRCAGAVAGRRLAGHAGRSLPAGFAAPLAPHLAAAAEGKQLDAALLAQRARRLARALGRRAGRGGRRADVAPGRGRVRGRPGLRFRLSAGGRGPQRAGRDQPRAANADRGRHVSRRLDVAGHRAQRDRAALRATSVSSRTPAKFAAGAVPPLLAEVAYRGRTRSTPPVDWFALAGGAARVSAGKDGPR